MAERKTTRATSGRAKSTKTTKKKVATKAASKKVKKVKKVTAKQVTKKTTKAKSLKKKPAKKSEPKVTKKKSPVVNTRKTEPKKKKTASKKPKETTTQKFSENVTIGTSHRLAFREKSITVFSRVKTDNAVILVARAFGLAFIFSGVFFSLITLNRAHDTGAAANVITSIDKFSAQVIGGTQSITDSSDNETQTLSEESLGDDNPASEPEDIDVNFKLPNSPVQGETTIHFSVEAKSVNVRLYSVSDNKDFDLGNAVSGDSRSWSKKWETSKFLNGDYYVKLVIVDKAGFSHYEKSDRPITVNNLAPESDITETETTTEADHITNSQSNQVLDFSDLNFAWKTPIPDKLIDPHKAEFVIDDAVYVRAIIKNNDTGKVYDVAEINEVDLGKWTLVIDPADLEPAAYRLTLQVKTTDETVLEGGRVGFEVPKVEDKLQLDDSNKASSTETVRAGETATVKELDQTEETVVEPESEIKVTGKDNLSGEVSVFVDTDGAIQTEVYLRRKNSLNNDFIGIAHQTAQQWRLIWDTTQTPNGEYEIFAKHKNEFGFYYSNYLKITVANKPNNKDAADEAYVEELQSTAKQIEDDVTIKTDLGKIADKSPDDEAEGSSTSSTSSNASESEHEELASEETRAKIETDQLLTKHERDLKQALRAYTEALRNEDDGEIEIALADLESIKRKAGNDAKQNPELVDLNDDINKAIDFKVESLTRDVEKTEKVIKERVGDAVNKDSDNDGITDYDEVSLYGTDPFSADSDNDGFNDDAEILGGYDPTNSSLEASIVFESPKEVGVVREDILKVEAIVADQNPGASDQATKVAPAIITGKALPNSFVRIYIFSTPIVVTVRTDDDGSWSYRFDKELEDGEHEVYVGVTDNGGKIVAKSEPLAFVKRAQAFTPVDAEAASATTVSEDSSPSLLDSNSLVIAMAAVITSLGFVLLLISLFMGKRKEEESLDSPSQDLVHVT